jgi:hypothetical protein
MFSSSQNAHFFASSGLVTAKPASQISSWIRLSKCAESEMKGNRLLKRASIFYSDASSLIVAYFRVTSEGKMAVTKGPLQPMSNQQDMAAIRNKTTLVRCLLKANNSSSDELA